MFAFTPNYKTVSQYVGNNEIVSHNYGANESVSHNFWDNEIVSHYFWDNEIVYVFYSNKNSSAKSCWFIVSSIAPNPLYSLRALSPEGCHHVPVMSVCDVWDSARGRSILLPPLLLVMCILSPSVFVASELLYTCRVSWYVCVFRARETDRRR